MILDRPALAGHGVLGAGGGFLFVRPEKVSLHAGTAGEGPNALAGRVLHASFLGNVVRYGVDVGAAEPLLCDAANASGSTGFAAGDAVVATWQPADCRLLAG